jgi:hypothetical protein
MATRADGTQRPFYDSVGGLWLSQGKRRRKAKGRAFVPGQDLLFKNPDGQTLFNEYRAIPAPPPGGAWEKVDLTPFFEHLEHLIPDEGERELFLDWVAYKFQHPERRPFAILMVADGAFGVGRSSVGQLLQGVFGPYAGVTDAKQLHSPYNGWLYAKTMIVCDEIMTGITGYRAGLELFDTIKTYIDTSAGKIGVNIKYGAQFEAINYASFLMFTNHADALHLPEGDRRICVLTNSTATMTKEQIAKLVAFKATEGVHLALRAMLLARDVSSFDVSTAPMTPAKAKMISMAKQDGDEIIEEIKSTFSDLVTKRQVLAYALHWTKANGTGTEETIDRFVKRDLERWFRSLDKLNDDNRHGGRINGEPVRCVRNAERWQEAFRPDVANLAHHAEVMKNQGVLDAYAKGKGPSPDKMS